MKFGKQLQAQQLPGWVYLDYKALKKIINSLAKGRPAEAALLAAGIRPIQESEEEGNEIQFVGRELQMHKAAFFFKLERELEKINTFYLQKEADLKVRLRSLIDKRKLVHASSAGKLTKHSSSFDSLYEGFRHFEKDLRKLQAFVEINAVGFRKILKKWDKRSKSTTKELYITRQIEVQPVFNREFISELSDVAAANVLELQHLLIEGGRDRWEVSRPSDSIADGITSHRFPTTTSARQRGGGGAEMDFIEFEELEVNLTKSVETGNRIMAQQLLNQLPIPELPSNQTSDVRNRLGRILWRATLTTTKIRQVGSSRLTDSQRTVMTPSSVMSETEIIPPLRLDFTFVDDINGRSCLHESAGAGRDHLVQLCIEHDVAISSADVYGRQPLHYAAMNGHPTVCNLLLGYGADPYAVDHDGFTPLIYAVTQGEVDCVKTFIDKDVELEPLNHGSLIPLSLACQHGHNEIALLMLQRGAQIIANQEGLWPQHLAAREGHAAVLRMLVQAGAKVDLEDKYSQWTPLFHAASEGHEACVQVLLDANCDIQPLDDVRRPPIHYAAWHGHIDCVNLLLAAGGAGKQSVVANPLIATGSASIKTPASDVFISGSQTTGSSGALDTMDTEADMIPSLSLPPPIIPFRIYGHNYLDKKTLVQVCLGHPNTSRSSSRTPVHIYGQPQLSTLKLVMTSRPDSAALAHSTILPLEDEREVFKFHVDSFDHFSLDFDVFPTFGTKIMGKAAALSSTFSNLQHQGQYILPLLDSHLKVIGEVSFEVTVIKPFEGVQLAMGGKVETYWKATANMRDVSLRPPLSTSTTISGQGSGAVVTASSLSGQHVRIVVQVTSDGVPIAYPHWSLPIKSFNIHISDVTLQEFLTFSSQQLGNNCNFHDMVNEMDASIWSMAISKSMVPLNTLLDTLPILLGIDLEMKFPTRSDCQRLNIRERDVNEFIDAILTTVYRSRKTIELSNDTTTTTTNTRRLVLSSFNPVVCTALNWKQPNYAVFFASHCGVSRSSPEDRLSRANRVEVDRRCTSLREAAKFAKTNNLLGLMLDSSILVQVPSLIQVTKEHGLLLTTFGSDSHDTIALGANAHLNSDGVLQYASRDFLEAVEL